jgi:hypothetical protein
MVRTGIFEEGTGIQIGIFGEGTMVGRVVRGGKLIGRESGQPSTVQEPKRKFRLF